MKIFFTALLLTAFFFSCSEDKSRVADIEQDVLFVSISKAERRDIMSTLKVSGRIRPYNAFNLVPKHGGIIKAIHCEIGDRVHKGQLLVEFDREVLEIQKRKAHSQFEVAKANHTSAERNFHRMERLYGENAISKAQFDNAENLYKTAKANLDLAKAYIDEIEQAINDSLLYSPIDGHIANKLFEAGDNVSAMMGNVPVLVIHQLDRIKIQVFVSFKSIDLVEAGNRVFIDGYEQEGSISQVGLSADPSSGNFPAEIVLENKDYHLRPGIFVRVGIVTDEKKNVLSIPRQALYGKNTVFVYDNGLVSERKVIISFEGDDHYAISHGVSESETVIVSHLYALRDNMRVRSE